MEFTWDVFVPGEDLPHRLTTDYIISEGEHVELIEPADDVEDHVHAATGSVNVLALSDLAPR